MQGEFTLLNAQDIKKLDIFLSIVRERLGSLISEKGLKRKEREEREENIGNKYLAPFLTRRKVPHIKFEIIIF